MLDFTNNKDKLKCNYFSLKKKKGLKMPIFVKNMGKQMLTPYTTDKKTGIAFPEDNPAIFIKILNVHTLCHNNCKRNKDTFIWGNKKRTVINSYFLLSSFIT